MKTKKRSAFLVFLTLVIPIFGTLGCQMNKNLDTPTTRAQVHPNSISEQPPAQSIPQPMSWMPSDQPVATQGEASVAVYLIELDSKQSLVLYSLSAPEARADELNASMVETGMDGLSSKESELLLKFGEVQFFASKFDPPQAKGQELHLKIESSKLGDGLDVQLTKEFAGIDSGQPLTELDRETVAGIGAVEQGGYRITFNGFFLNTGDLNADQLNEKPRTQQEDILAASNPQNGRTVGPLATPEPQKPSETLVQMAEGKPVRTQLTLRIENLSTKEVKFLYIITLDDGQVKAKFIE